MCVCGRMYRNAQVLYLSAGYSDCGDGYDAFAWVGVGCELDDRKDFVGCGMEKFIKNQLIAFDRFFLWG